jgi:hypothetical protein
MALRDALHSLLDRLDWRQYEELSEDINKIKETLENMKNYNWRN